MIRHFATNSGQFLNLFNSNAFNDSLHGPRHKFYSILSRCTDYRSYFILLFLLFGVLSYFCPTFWGLSAYPTFWDFSYFCPTFRLFPLWDLILILTLIFNTSPIYLYILLCYLYCLVFCLTFLVTDMEGKPNLP